MRVLLQPLDPFPALPVPLVALPPFSSLPREGGCQPDYWPHSGLQSLAIPLLFVSGDSGFPGPRFLERCGISQPCHLPIQKFLVSKSLSVTSLVDSRCSR